jgi:acetyl esterase/lipase
MRYVRYNAKKFGIDPDRVGIMGFSAGAHLACTVAEHYDNFECKVDEIDEQSARPDLLCLCYPVITMGKAISHNGSCENLLGDREDGLEECIEDLSCEDNIRADMPPVFILHTFEDSSVDCRNSLVMASRLKERNIKCELHLFPDGRHGIDLARDVEGTKEWFGLFANWLKRCDFLQ